MGLQLVIHPPIDDARLKRVAAAAGKMEIINAPDEPAARRSISAADAFFGKLTPELLASSARLRWVQCPTASLEHFVFPELVAHPCILTNMRGLYSDVVADHVMAFVLCISKNLHIYLRQQLQSKWHPIGGGKHVPAFDVGPGVQSSADLAHMHLPDATLGIVGLGHIGEGIAARADAFGMKIVAIDPTRDEIPETVSQLWRPHELDRLLAMADFVVIAAPHTPETENWFQRAQFRWMKPSSWLINIGRGAIVSLSDLVAALNAQEIAGAALDVFETEPLPADNPLWKMENVIITPHIAACSPRIAQRHLEVLCDNVSRFARGEQLRNVVDKVRWY